MVIGAFEALADVFTAGDATAAASWLSSRAGLTTWIRAAQSAGLSGRGTLAAFRAAGGSVADTTFWHLRQQVLQAANPFSGLTRTLDIATSSIQKVTGGREGLYQVNFRSFVRHAAESGFPTFSTLHTSFTSREMDLDAFLSKMDDLTNQLNDESGDYGRIMGYEIASVMQYTG